ncbi:hypothetical protein Hypma_014875 [Hypsizygus marmoreus]|uniref:PARP catalytic domain-containing protein n=1 Tax=Hypsizygus marmoreus TaxID=39966 RepID=A0A369K6S9_HYPMA|nr:hypothetical protein Hypma_014875 [Hypsizygus marmoreus]
MFKKTLAHWGNSQNQAPDLCEICNARPKFVENGFKHNYCSRTCARNGQGPSPAPCKLGGCRATGKSAFADFCSEAHAKEGVLHGAVAGCENCNTLPSTVNDLCIPCDRRAQSVGGIRELRANGRTFKNYRDQFLNEWSSPEPVPTVEKIYEVDITHDARTSQNAYRAKIPSCVEIRTYHSSQCICNFGANNNSGLCNFKSCGICCIVKSSFSSFAFGVPFNNGRFGDGIYSYRNPALADNFATSCTSSPYRVSIGCSVVVESGTTGSSTSIDPASVFVPTADAILPVCIIVYRK